MLKIFHLLVLIFTVKAATKVCQHDWTEFDGMCYLYPRDSGGEYSLKSFEHAEAECTRLDARLPAIHDFPLNNFLKYRLGPPQYWIGLKRHTRGGMFTWTDGVILEAWDFSQWYPGNPDSDRRHHACVRVWRGSFWKDGSCEKKLLPFVCEREPDRVRK